MNAKLPRKRNTSPLTAGMAIHARDALRLRRAKLREELLYAFDETTTVQLAAVLQRCTSEDKSRVIAFEVAQEKERDDGEV